MCVCVLQHASNLEQKQNETENKKVHGDVVKYGTVIQVMTHHLFLYRYYQVKHDTTHLLSHVTVRHHRSDLDKTQDA